MSAHRRGTSDQLSLREKSLLKRRINQEHSSNFRAGYVHIDEEQLHKTGIRGRKALLVFVLIALLVLVAIVNLLMTVTILAAAHVGMHGMAALEFLPAGLLLRFLGPAQLDRVWPADSTIGGLADSNLKLSGNASGPLVLRVNTEHMQYLSVDVNEIAVEGVDTFLVVDPDTSQVVFTTDYPEFYNLPRKLKNLKSKQIVTNKVRGVKELRLSSEKGNTHLRGSAGIRLRGQGLQAEGHNIHLQGSEHVELLGEAGIFLDELPPHYQGEEDGNEYVSKLCVSYPSGALFRIPASSSCHVAAL